MKTDTSKVVDGKTYMLDFYDGFEGPALATDKWIPQYLPQWTRRPLAEPRYRLTSDGLLLLIEPDQLPWCPEFNGPVRVSSLQTGVFSGPAGSKAGQHRFSKDCIVREEWRPQKLYTPCYGFIEFRARCEISSHNVAALWMIGFEETPEQSAEICIFELKGTNIDSESAIIGYGIKAFDDPELAAEFYEESFNIDTTQFNTYAAEWTPDHVSFFINGRKIRTINQAPQYTMQLMLNLYDLENKTSENMRFCVDYIAGYTVS